MNSKSALKIENLTFYKKNITKLLMISALKWKKKTLSGNILVII